MGQTFWKDTSSIISEVFIFLHYESPENIHFMVRVTYLNTESVRQIFLKEFKNLQIILKNIL